MKHPADSQTRALCRWRSRIFLDRWRIGRHVSHATTAVAKWNRSVQSPSSSIRAERYAAGSQLGSSRRRDDGEHSPWSGSR